MKKSESLLVIVLMAVIPVLVYLQFLAVRVYVISGDDLVGYQELTKAQTLPQIFELSTYGGKFRPVCILAAELLFNLFHKNLAGYYMFNVVVQTVSAYMMAMIFNLFLRSPVRSLAFSLTYALIRFSFYSCSQVVCGGALEGLAMLLFLICLFFMLKAVIQDEVPVVKVVRYLLLSLLFANLSIYTHERYIVVFPFIVLLILLFPGLKRLGARSRILIGTIAIASAFANVAIKKYALGMSFFVGTASTKMTFSLSSIIPFLKDALKCIFQINTGNLGHTGSFFHDLPLWQKLLVLSLTLVFLVTLLGYTLRTAAAYRTLSKEQKTKFLVFLSLPVLLFFCLLPAVVTIRLEQRWLQAPFGIFLVMFVIAFSSIHFENTRRQNQAVAFFTLFFLAVNANYYYRGSNFLYLNSAQKCAAMFEKGTRSGVIRPGSGTLYIWSKPMNLADNAFVNWSIGGGYLFEFYQGKSKQLVFVDSAYLHTPGCYADIGKDSSQVISMSLTDYVVADLTRQFLKDSLKSLN